MNDDYSSIMEVLTRYCEACDTKQWSLFADVFSDDATGIYHGHLLGSRHAIVEHVRTHLGGVGASQHLIANFMISIDGDEATSRCQVRAWHQGIGRWEGSHYEAFGEYTDVLERRDAGWRLVKRELVVRAQLGSRDLLGP